MQAAESQQLQVFNRQYLQYVPTEDLRWPDGSILRSIYAQKWLFDNAFDTNGAIKYFPPERYQFRVLKKLVELIQGSIKDPEEDVRKIP
jgi:protein-lysine N-methyltransferase EEF2KMT